MNAYGGVHDSTVSAPVLLKLFCVQNFVGIPPFYSLPHHSTAHNAGFSTSKSCATQSVSSPSHTSAHITAHITLHHYYSTIINTDNCCFMLINEINNQNKSLFNLICILFDLFLFIYSSFWSYKGLMFQVHQSKECLHLKRQLSNLKESQQNSCGVTDTLHTSTNSVSLTQTHFSLLKRLLQEKIVWCL